MEHNFLIVDVFAVEKYTGNQLAVFLDGSDISSEEMQKIAREINFSETTFILPHEKADEESFKVRIFTPKSEIDFAGHPTLGTAYIIRKYILKNDAKTVKLNLRAGEITVSFDKEIWMKQNEPKFGRKFSPEYISKVIGLSPDEIDSCFPSEEISTGLPFTIVPVRTMDSLRKARISEDDYQNFISIADAKGIMVFCPFGYTNDQKLSSRVFVNYLGIPEDPATGSATGCLAGYLLKNRYFDSSDISLKIGQGYEINRPSELSIKGCLTSANSYDIFVGGQVEEIAGGNWIL